MEGSRLRSCLHWSEDAHCSKYFGSETKQAKTANDVQTRKRKQNEIKRKKRAVSILSLLFIFLDRIVTAVAAVAEMVDII